METNTQLCQASDMISSTPVATSICLFLHLIDSTPRCFRHQKSCGNRYFVDPAVQTNIHLRQVTDVISSIPVATLSCVTPHFIESTFRCFRYQKSCGNRYFVGPAMQTNTQLCQATDVISSNPVATSNCLIPHFIESTFRCFRHQKSCGNRYFLDPAMQTNTQLCQVTDVIFNLPVATSNCVTPHLIESRLRCFRHQNSCGHRCFVGPATQTNTHLRQGSDANF